MSEPSRPVLRVVTPDATPEEVAALVAVLSAAGGGEAALEPVHEWSHPARLVRRSPASGAASHGRAGWRSSALPR